MAERERLRIPQPVIVEGRYDKIRLSNVIDATVMETAGFGIFSKKEKLSLLKTLAAPCGIIILTDSDGAGKLIRAHLSSALPPEKVYHLYIPQIPGKERRKSTPSKAGTLGVEGMEDSLLRELFLPFAMEADGTSAPRRGGITKADLYALSLTGTAEASARRDSLAVALGLPLGMTPNALLGAINILFDREAFLCRAAEILSITISEDAP